MIDRPDDAASARGARQGAERPFSATDAQMQRVVAQFGRPEPTPPPRRGAPKALKSARNRLQASRVQADRLLQVLTDQRKDFAAVVAQIEGHEDDAAPLGPTADLLGEIVEQLAGMILRLEQAREEEVASGVWRNPAE